MNEELDSQLSAMFDDELLPAECELLARRLSRDEHLKARWGRYAIIGAVIRAERGVRLNAPLAGRVNAVLLAEPALAAHTAPRDRSRAPVRWWQPLAGAAVAAGVATVSILWLRTQAPLPFAGPMVLALVLDLSVLLQIIGHLPLASGGAGDPPRPDRPPLPGRRA